MIVIACGLLCSWVCFDRPLRLFPHSLATAVYIIDHVPLLLHISSVYVHVCVPAGEFGVVYRGNLTGWRNTGQELVAVKTLKGYDYINICKQNIVSCLWPLLATDSSVVER